MIDRDDVTEDDDLPIVETMTEPTREYLVRPVYLDPPSLAITSRLVAGGYVLSRETDACTLRLHEAIQLRDALAAAISQMESLTMHDKLAGHDLIED